ncbi:putative membrane protein YfcA [Pullulanibacillus pueri]|uniref:Probable membrane transporter protein n=1 Tax=Pullulanibacillus pueri TaxID=1437324 RepID=A0A8J2ZV35_9BACL|nr:sulfite exporter TauE/SafE family protein [Pullulanibacillus pueri]MBM7682052.1 putative membrane protein YfcA [Pullulanibacillus pueri]GGH80161.1 hypothetical protein GCM10007096_16160 [Pullulanibacillus pueri]
MLHYFLLLIIALLCGAYGVLIGAGGGFIFVPILLIFFNIPTEIAAGTGIVIVMINSLSGIMGYARQKKIDYKMGILLAIGATPGTFLGIWLNHIGSSNTFYMVFAIIVLLLGFFLLLSRNPSKKKEKKHAEVAATLEAPENEYLQKRHSLKIIALLAVGLGLGIASGYLGIGGGWLLVPILIYGFQIATHRATATSLFSLCLYSAIGVITQIAYGNVDWWIVLWGGIGVFIGGQLGSLLSDKLSGKWIIKLLSIILIGVGIQLLFGQ